MADSRDSSTGIPALTVVIAIVILVAVVAALFLFNPHKIAEFSVTKVDLFAPHTEFQATPGSTHILGQGPQTEDDLYVVVHLRITDKLRIPIFLSDWSAVLKLSNGSLADATTVSARDLPRLEQIFPAITPLASQPLEFGDEVSPGAPRDATIVLLFPNTAKDAWQNRQTAALTLNLRNQGTQLVSIPKP